MILLTQEQYPQPISIEFLSEKISLLDNVSEGDEVKVGINIRGREWTSPQGETKYFNSITGWRLEKAAAGNSYNEPTQAQPQQMLLQLQLLKILSLKRKMMICRSDFSEKNK